MRNIFEYHDEGIYLEHHGILGQKWGIRRFQNRDGSLTAEGKQRYGQSLEKSNAQKAIENGASQYATKQEKIEAITSDCWLMPSSNYPKNGVYGTASKQDQQRITDAAKLGIKALNKYSKREFGYDENADPNDPDTQWWFVYEDGTIGMATVADLINQGYSAREVSKLCQLVHENYEGSKATYSDRADAACFELEEDYKGSLQRFAKYCEEEYKRSNS